MSTSSDARNPIELLAEEFLDRKRRGEDPTLREYVERHPDLAAEIRDLFPALLMIEDFRDRSGAKKGALAADHGAALGIQLERLGDYRILREIGRGGMGVVYEAEQESLGRRVAVKVLSVGALLDPKQLRRFEHEAKSAAKLHHTNIVPVFGVGHQDGHYYYVMQFIAGPGLDAVLNDLRRLRQTKPDSDALGAPDARLAPGESNGPTAADVARSLVSGRFAADEHLFADPGATVPTDAISPAIASIDAEHSREPDPTSAVLPESVALPSTSHPDGRFYRGIARIGIEAAHALEYANRQGILHRDVKPSNLLLDAHGHVWVADFGLAKTAERDDLTDTGDIVGTVRYMAPERFAGQCDARSDVYSLGLTLYELVALQPAYYGADRQTLIERVLHEAPARLSKLAPNVPRDLNTIVAKAIARDPGNRYATAGALADDLQRFVEDRPIRARRVSPAERLARWCRRNPVIAALLGLAAFLLCLVATVSSIGFVRTRAALGRERVALGRERTALTGERAARQKAVDNLYHASVGEARALRTARVGGYRGKVFELLGRATLLDTLERNPGELRREASAGLGDFVGLEPLVLCEFNSPSTAMTIHPRSEWIAVGMGDGTVRLHNPATGNELARLAKRQARVTALSATPEGSLWIGRADGTIELVAYELQSRTLRATEKPSGVGSIGGFYPILGGATRVVVDGPTAITIRDVDGAALFVQDFAQGIPGRTGGSRVGGFVISPDGRLAATGLQFSEPPYIELMVWDLAAPRRVRHVSLAFLSSMYQCAFSPDSTRVAVGGDLGFIVIETADLSTRLAVSLDSATSIAFGLDGKTLAVATISRRVKLWSLTTNRELAELRHAGPETRLQVALSPDGRTLTSRASDSLSVWNVAGADERMELAGHASGVTSVSFSPDSTTLASTSKDGTVGLWEPATGRLRRTLGGYPADVQACAFSPDGTLLATGSLKNGQLRIWDTQSWQEAYAPDNDARPPSNFTGLSFLPGPGSELGLAATSRNSGLEIWRLNRNANARGPLHRIVQLYDLDCFHLALSHDGALAAYNSGGIVKVWDMARAHGLEFSGPRLLLGWHGLAFRPRGDLVYISSDGVAIVWDVRANRLTRTIGRPETFQGFHIAVSRDGRWLAAEATPSSVAIVDLELGEVVFTFREERSPIWSLAWAHDARRLAVGLSDGGLVVWDLERVRALLAASGIDAPSTSDHPEEFQVARPVRVLDLDRLAARRQQADQGPARADAAASSSRHEGADASATETLTLDATGALKNPAFEDELEGWETSVYGARSTIGFDKDVVREGRRSLRVTATEISDTAFGQEVELKPGHTYRLSGWVRTRGLDPHGSPVYGTFQVQHPTGRGRYTHAVGTNHGGDTEWTEVTITFQAPANGRVRICAFFVGFGKGTGTAWFDDLHLVEVNDSRR
jgi:eukaryotic-like serine/threonine-protein kinase